MWCVNAIWTRPSPVLHRRFVRTSKSDPLVDKVELIDVNPAFACVRYTDGRESSVSLRDFAPCPSNLTTEHPCNLHSRKNPHHCKNLHLYNCLQVQLLDHLQRRNQWICEFLKSSQKSMTLNPYQTQKKLFQDFPLEKVNHQVVMVARPG